MYVCVRKKFRRNFMQCQNHNLWSTSLPKRKYVRPTSGQFLSRTWIIEVEHSYLLATRDVQFKPLFQRMSSNKGCVVYITTTDCPRYALASHRASSQSTTPQLSFFIYRSIILSLLLIIIIIQLFTQVAL